MCSPGKTTNAERCMLGVPVLVEFDGWLPSHSRGDALRRQIRQHQRILRVDMHHDIGMGAKEQSGIGVELRDAHFAALRQLAERHRRGAAAADQHEAGAGVGRGGLDVGRQIRMTDIDREAHDQLTLRLRHLGKAAQRKAVAAFAIADERQRALPNIPASWRRHGRRADPSPQVGLA